MALLPTRRKQDFTDFSYYAKIPSGRQIFAEGDEVNGLAHLMSGVVRVFKLGQTGRQITLYRFGQGESCIITANAILHQQGFPAVFTCGVIRIHSEHGDKPRFF